MRNRATFRDLTRRFPKLILGNDAPSSHAGSERSPAGRLSALSTLLQQPILAVADLVASGVHIDETEYLAVGGGLGSFVWVDHLVVHGAAPRQIAVIGPDRKPYALFEELCTESLLTGEERLRSNSDACPDNLWGCPGYAVRETARALARGRLRHALGVSWKVFGEPAIAETYTPKVVDVLRSIDREAARIGWGEMWRPGRVHAIRKTDDGRYAVAFSQSPHYTDAADCVMLARYVHLAVGHAGVRMMPATRDYRVDTGDFATVVNAYEPHRQLYDALAREGGTVVLRGRGIVASRILQRLEEVHRENPRTAVVHLIRSPMEGDRTFGRARRRAVDNWDYQPFNWPKSCWGGDLRYQLERAGVAERTQLLDTWGGTTTSPRAVWRQIVSDGLETGWYRQQVGEIGGIQRLNGHGLSITLRNVHNGNGGSGSTAGDGSWPSNGNGSAVLTADYVTDCTGLDDTVEGHPLLHDLIEHYCLSRNPKGRLEIDNDFAVAGMANGPARIYASGAMTFGGPFAAVDSFLGLQYAAWASTQSLIAQRAPGLRRLGPLVSCRQWLKWARGARP